MKLAPILVLCLAVSIHQTTAKAFSFDAISDGIRSAGSAAQGIAGAAGSVASGIAGTAGEIASGIAKGASGAAQGAIGAATGIAKGVIGVKAEIDARIADKAASVAKDISEKVQNVQNRIADKAASVAKDISEKVQNVQNRILKGALQSAQSTLQKIQDNSRGVLEASEVAAKNSEAGLIEVEEKKNKLIEEWAEKATSKLANASPETQEKGQDLINGFVNNKSEAIKQASDEVLLTLESVQEKAHATADKYHEPMNKLIEQVGKCSELKVSQIRELVKCGGEIQKDLVPLATAPGELAAIKRQLIKAAGQSIVKDIRVKNALSQFRDQSKQVEFILDQLVAQDQQKQEQQPEEEEEAAPQEDEQSEDQQSEDQQSEDQQSEDQQSEDQQSEDEPADEEQQE